MGFLQEVGSASIMRGKTGTKAVFEEGKTGKEGLVLLVDGGEGG